VYSEGAQFFVLEDKKTNKSYAKLIDVAIYNVLAQNEVGQELINFLKKNNLTIPDIDMMVLGINGDVEYDEYYTILQESVLMNTAQVYYKHFSGEYNTASAFGMWMACNIFKNQKIPESIQLNAVDKTSIKNVLLYNQYRGENHSFVLLSSC
jgi:3-oxoacyl-(acyl-carrier-protein) synthase